MPNHHPPACSLLPHLHLQQLQRRDPNPLITRYESLRARLKDLDKQGESFSEEAQEIDRELVEIKRELPGDG